jgi:hypothetical protein
MPYRTVLIVASLPLAAITVCGLVAAFQDCPVPVPSAAPPAAPPSAADEVIAGSPQELESIETLIDGFLAGLAEPAGSEVPEKSDVRGAVAGVRVRALALDLAERYRREVPHQEPASIDDYVALRNALRRLGADREQFDTVPDADVFFASLERWAAACEVQIEHRQLAANIATELDRLAGELGEALDRDQAERVLEALVQEPCSRAEEVKDLDPDLPLRAQRLAERARCRRDWVKLGDDIPEDYDAEFQERLTVFLGEFADAVSLARAERGWVAEAQRALRRQEVLRWLEQLTADAVHLEFRELLEIAANVVGSHEASGADRGEARRAVERRLTTDGLNVLTLPASLSSANPNFPVREAHHRVEGRMIGVFVYSDSTRYYHYWESQVAYEADDSKIGRKHPREDFLPPPPQADVMQGGKAFGALLLGWRNDYEEQRRALLGDDREFDGEVSVDRDAWDRLHAWVGQLTDPMGQLANYREKWGDAVDVDGLSTADWHFDRPAKVTTQVRDNWQQFQAVFGDP